MMKLQLDSERVAPTGNVTSKGIMNQLGRPNLDVLAVLVREAVQNSWDARASDEEAVRFGVRGWKLDSYQRQVLREVVFTECPPHEGLPILTHLASDEDFNVLAVYDRGTSGLGGPTRADISTPADEARDFVDFLRNVGQPPDKQFAGGTYGYGKAAFYRASRVHTICVHTHCQFRGQLESRFMASALGEPYTAGRYRYTGRHWWGEMRDEIVEPLLNRKADEIADAVGLPSFAPDERGTTVLVLQPILGDLLPFSATSAIETIRRTPLQALNLITEYLLYFFWPKMLRYANSHPSMIFEAAWQGEKINIPDPADFPPLQGFVQAMQLLKNKAADSNSPFQTRVAAIASQRPAKHLGELVLQQFPSSGVRTPKLGTNHADSPFVELTHHTALMRQPELVVKYLAGTGFPNERLGYAGVFIVDPAVDPVFAKSEPPTHDDWVAESLEDSWHKRYVKAVYREVEKEMDVFAKPPAARSALPSLTPLGAFANRLGSSLLPSEPGPAATFKPFRPNSVSSNIEMLSRQPIGEGSSSNQPTYPVLDPMLKTTDEGDVAPPGIQAVLQPLDSASEPLSTQIPPNYSPSPNETPTYEPPQYDPPAQTFVGKPKVITGRARVRALSDGDYILLDGIPALEVEFSVVHAGNSAGTVVQAVVSAILDGSQKETEPPLGGSTARVIRWIAPNGIMYAGSEEVFISFDIQGNWHVVISLPDDMMLGLELRAEAKAEI